MKNRERVLQGALELFNRYGEPNVGTNRICAYLRISSGNLYYHFASKQDIVRELFERYMKRMDALLVLPAPDEATLPAMRRYLVGKLEMMWDYRFIYRDLENLVDADAVLASMYHQFVEGTLAKARRLFGVFAEAGILQLDEETTQAAVINTWIILMSWTRIACSLQVSNQLNDETLLDRAVYQALMALLGFTHPDYRVAIVTLSREFHTTHALLEGKD